MKSLVLKVEIIAGTSDHDAARDICGLAKDLDLLVEANFNGVRMNASPSSDFLQVRDKHREESKAKL